MSRLQKRAIHYVCQKAEGYVQNQVQETMPLPCSTDVFHPCKQLLCLRTARHGVYTRSYYLDSMFSLR